MNNRNVIIAGYPKSGTTWLSRLVAELIACPLSGDWGFEEIDAPYREGMERHSEYRCYKSHHLYSELFKASEGEIYKIIYIVRDPRDIVVSGMYYFDFHKSRSINQPAILKRILNRITALFITKKYRKKAMMKAVLEGNEALNPWLKYSWEEHVSTFINQNVYIVKYEDLLMEPIKECAKIAGFIGVDLEKNHLESSVSNQSFQKRKVRDKDKKDTHQRKLLRKGGSGYWKDEFQETELNAFKHLNKSKNELQKLYTF